MAQTTMSVQQPGSSNTNNEYQYIDAEYIRGPSIDDISVNIEGCSFEKAVGIIHNPPSKYEVFSLLMFRNVVAPVNINYSNYINKLKEDSRKSGLDQQLVHYERLQNIKEGVYFNEKIIVGENESERLLKQILDEEPPENVERDDWNLSKETIENLFRNSNVGRAYLRDLQTPPEETGCCLENIESNISINRNENIGEMPGINTSMHYIGEKGSYTTLHEEDGGLSSINILKSGSPKIWFIIDYRWQAEVERNFADYLKEQQLINPICDQILKHKIYLITPKLLMAWKIPYSVVVQRPGDLFFIRSGTYHAVVNVGKNLAEAINYGCSKWNSSYQPKTCDCEESNKSDVYQDRRVIVTHKNLKKKLFQCNKDDCEEVFLTKQKLHMHQQKIHKEVIKCLICLKIFTSTKHLKRHEKMHSNNGGKEQCSICKKMVLRLSEHKNNVHQKSEECNFCKKHFSKTSLKKHQKTCQTEFICTICSKLCSNNSGLARHMKVHN